MYCDNIGLENKGGLEYWGGGRAVATRPPPLPIPTPMSPVVGLTIHLGLIQMSNQQSRYSKTAAYLYQDGVANVITKYADQLGIMYLTTRAL